jgi:hypothetical protein
MAFPWAVARLLPSAVRVRIRSRSTSARSPSTTAPRFLLAQLRKWAPHHFRRSCDLSSLTSSAAHSRASVIFSASLKARAFARAWLSDDRSAADSFPDCVLRALRVAADMLRIGPVQGSNSGSAGDNLDRRRVDRNFYSLPPARGVAGSRSSPIAPARDFAKLGASANAPN